MAHECDGKGCGRNLDECYCTGCIDEIKQAAYNEGFGDGKKEGHSEGYQEAKDRASVSDN